MGLRSNARALFVLAAVLYAIPAAAQTTSVRMGGEWFSNRGPLVDIPLAGGAEYRNPLVNGLHCFPQTGCLASFKPREGGLKAPLTVDAATLPITTNGTAPATFHVPPAVFTFNYRGPLGNTSSGMVVDGAAVTTHPTVISLTTNFAAVAPAATSLTAMSFMSAGGATLTQVLNPQTSFMASRINLTPGGAVASVVTTTIMGPNAVPNVLRAGAWTTQTGRPGADFSICRGIQTGLARQGTSVKLGAVLNCTTPNYANDPATGTFGKWFNGLISYTAGPNQFGGTMMMLLDGSGRLAAVNPATPYRLPATFYRTGDGLVSITPNAPGAGGTETRTPRVCVWPLGWPGLLSGFRNQITGAGFLFASSTFAGQGACHRGLVQTPGQRIATLGPLLPPDIVKFSISTPNQFFWDRNRPFADQTKSIGAPFTTGTVVVQNTGTFEGQPATTTLSLRGSLNTSMGVGNITLVAGALASRVRSDESTSRLTYVRMVTFAPEPGASLMLGVALVGLGGAYRFVPRRSVV